MTGGAIVDITLVLIALGAMVSGWRQGGFSAFLSFLGVLIGGFVGINTMTPATDFVGKHLSDGDGVRFLTAIITVVVGVVIGYALGTWLGQKLRDAIRSKSTLRVESAVGAVVQAFTTLLVIWLIIVPLASNDEGNFGDAVRGSNVLSSMSRVAPNWVKNLPAKTGAYINSSGFPVVTDPFDTRPQREVDPPTSGISALPKVEAASESVVHVVAKSQKCRRLLQGSGFVVDKDTVMTNAHVVAGTETTQLATPNGLVDAEVVYYNPTHDIALLRAPGLGMKPLKWDNDGAKVGEDSVVLGYPNGGPFEAVAARVRDRFMVSGPNIYANDRVDREAYAIRGTVVQGNSGGPLVDTDGEVLGLVFGADVKESDTGYALTRDEVLAQVGDYTKWNTPVDTQRCVAS